MGLVKGCDFAGARGTHVKYKYRVMCAVNEKPAGVVFIANLRSRRHLNFFSFSSSCPNLSVYSGTV